MIVVEPGFPDAVLAVTASERVTAADYRDVLTPALEDRLGRHAQLRFLYHLGADFKRFTTTALWDDPRLGFHHLRDFERVAIVTDVDWLGQLARQTGQALGLEIRQFGNAELDQARAWICEGLA